MLPPHGVWLIKANQSGVEGLESAATPRSLVKLGYFQRRFLNGGGTWWDEINQQICFFFYYYQRRSNREGSLQQFHFEF